MPIKEDAFRIGCGRYIQEPNAIQRAGDEILKLGHRPLIIGGKTAWELTRNKLEASIEKKCNTYEVIVYTGSCNDESAKTISAMAKEKNCDVIVGVGGGVICDFAKLCAYYTSLPIINIPTSSATCAAYTPLSVRYTPDGKTVGSLHYPYEVNCVLADTEILVAQPVRLFIAGVLDALAKFVEIKQRYREGVTDYPLGLDYAYLLSQYTFRTLSDCVQSCIYDMENGRISDTFEKTIFTTIAATGVISGIARGSNQTALAHKFYETTRFLFSERTKKFTHGEIVGVGLLLQNHFNAEAENNRLILGLMKNYHLPSCIEDLGIDMNSEVFDAYYKKLCESSAIESEHDAERLKESMKYLWGVNSHDKSN